MYNIRRTKSIEAERVGNETNEQERWLHVSQQDTKELAIEYWGREVIGIRYAYISFHLRSTCINCIKTMQ